MRAIESGVAPSAPLTLFFAALDRCVGPLDDRVDVLDQLVGGLDQAVGGLDRLVGVAEGLLRGDNVSSLDCRVGVLDHRVDILDRAVDRLDRAVGCLDQPVGMLDQVVGKLHALIGGLRKRGRRPDAGGERHSREQSHPCLPCEISDGQRIAEGPHRKDDRRGAWLSRGYIGTVAEIEQEPRLTPVPSSTPQPNFGTKKARRGSPGLVTVL